MVSSLREGVMPIASSVQGSVIERRVSRAGLLSFLEDLDARSVAGGLTVHMGPGRSQEHLTSLGGEHHQVRQWLGQLAPTLAKSATGAVVFWSEGGGYAVMPPFPVEGDGLREGWDASLLRALLSREYLLGVVLLRLGRYAVGVLEGEVLVASKTDSRYVKGKHSAGGQSQKRFARIREKQAHELFKKTCTVVGEQFAPYEGKLDYVLLGGERHTLRGLVDVCDYLQRLSPRILGRVLNVREPKLEALQRVSETVWESRVFTIPSEESPQ